MFGKIPSTRDRSLEGPYLQWETERNAEVHVWRKWYSNTELIFRADKHSRRFGSCDDSHVAYISYFKNSPSMLKEWVEIHLSYP